MVQATLHHLILCHVNSRLSRGLSVLPCHCYHCDVCHHSTVLFRHCCVWKPAGLFRQAFFLVVELKTLKIGFYDHNSHRLL